MNEQTEKMSSGLRRYVILIDSRWDQGHSPAVVGKGNQDGKCEQYIEVLKDYLLNSSRLTHSTSGNTGFSHQALQLGSAVYFTNIRTIVDSDSGDVRVGSVGGSQWSEINSELSAGNIEEMLSNTGRGGSDKGRLVSVSESLHSHADQLPEDGGYLVDVIWLMGGEKFRHQINADITVYGSLKRLAAWHNGHLTVVTESESGLNWFCKLNATFVTTPAEFSRVLQNLRLTLWRGCLSQSGTDLTVLPHFYLSLAPDKQSDSTPNTNTNTAPHKQLTTKTDRIVLSQRVDVVQTMTLSSVPGYLVSPVRMTLSNTDGNDPDTPSSRFLDDLLVGEDSALLLRLQVYHADTVEHDFPLSSETWKKRIVQNPLNCDPPELRSNKPNECCYLIAFRDFPPNIPTFPPQDPSVGGRLSVFVLYSEQLVSGRVAQQLAHQQLFDDCKNCSKLNHPDEIMKRQFQKFVFDQFLKSDEDIGGRAGAGVVPYERFTQVMRESETLLDKLKANSDPKFEKLQTLFLKTHNPGVVPADISWTDCPEAQFLLNLEFIKSKYSRQKSSDELLAGIPPPPATSDKLTLSVNDIMSYFDSTGQSSAANLSPVPVKNRLKYRQQCVETLSRLTFTESLEQQWHGIDYNEAIMYTPTKDRKLVLVQRRFVANDTASTFYPGGRGGNMVIQQKESKLGETKLRPTRAAKRPRSGDDGRVEKSVRDDEVPVKISSSQSTDQGSGVSESEKQVPESKDLRSRGSKDKTEKQSRSDRHKRRLKMIVDDVLLKNEVDNKHKHYTDCSAKLYRICMLYLKDLKTSRGLNQEMKQTAEMNVKQVVQFFTRSENK